MTEATLSVILRAVDNLSPTLQKAEGKLGQFQSRVEKFSKGVGTAIKNVSVMVGSLGALVASTGYLGAKFEKTFQNAMTMFDVTEKEISQLQNTIQKLGIRYGTSFENLADALYSVGSAGIKAENASKVLEQSVRAATAGATDMNTAFQSAIGIINAYGMSIEDLNTVYAMQFEAVQKGLLTYTELARDIGQWIPAARNLGVSLREGVAGYVALTKAGIRSAEAANAVEGAFQDIMQQADKFKKFGISIYNTEGKFLGLTRVVEQLAEKMGDMTDDQKRMFLGQISLSETGTRAIMTWVNNLEKYKDVLGGIQGSTAALEDALKKQTSSVSFMLNQLKVALQSLGLSIFQAIRPQLTQFIAFALDKLVKLSEWIERNSETIGALIWSFLKFGTMLLGILIPLKFFAETIRALANPIVLVLTGIAGALASIWKLQNPGKGFVDFLLYLGQVAENVWNTFKAWGEEIAQLMEAKNAKGFWDRLVVFLEWFFTKVGQGAEQFLTWLGEKFLNLLKWLWEQIKNGSGALWDWIKEVFSALGQWLFEVIVVPLVDALQQIFKKSVDWMKDIGEGIVGGLKTAGKGIATFGGWLIGKGWLWGKQEGGFTGEGAENEPAGIVHKGEYVIPAWMVKKHPYLVATLEKIRTRGYKKGGYVYQAGGLVTGGFGGLFDELIKIVHEIEERLSEKETGGAAPEKAKHWWDDFFKTAKEGFKKFSAWYQDTFIADLLEKTQKFKNDFTNFIINTGSQLLNLPGGSILYDIAMSLWSAVSALENVQALLDPITTVVNAMMAVLGPVINNMLAPFVSWNL